MEARVRVYRNLRRLDWSILDPRSNRVIGHRADLVLVSVRFLVSERVRQRVIRAQRRTVHAYAEGLVSDQPVREGGDRIHYNPFEAGCFTCAGQALTTAERVDFQARWRLPGGRMKLVRGRVLRDFQRAVVEDQDIQVVRFRDDGESVLAPARYVVTTIPQEWSEPRQRLTRSWSSKRRALKDAVPILDRTGGRLLENGKGGWREAPIWWWVRTRLLVEERRLVALLRDWAGFSLKEARRLARILNAAEGSIQVALTHAETRTAVAATDEQRSRRFDAGLLLESYNFHGAHRIP